MQRRHFDLLVVDFDQSAVTVWTMTCLTVLGEVCAGFGKLDHRGNRGGRPACAERGVAVFVGVAVSVQAIPTRARATQVKASRISFISSVLRLNCFTVFRGRVSIQTRNVQSSKALTLQLHDKRCDFFHLLRPTIYPKTISSAAAGRKQPGLSTVRRCLDSAPWFCGYVEQRRKTQSTLLRAFTA